MFLVAQVHKKSDVRQSHRSADSLRVNSQQTITLRLRDSKQQCYDKEESF